MNGKKVGTLLRYLDTRYNSMAIVSIQFCLSYGNSIVATPFPCTMFNYDVIVSMSQTQSTKDI